MFCGTCITMGGRKGKKDPNAKHAKIFAKHNSFKKDKQCSLQNLDIDTKEMITDAKPTVMHQITLDGVKRRIRRNRHLEKMNAFTLTSIKP